MQVAKEARRKAEEEAGKQTKETLKQQLETMKDNFKRLRDDVIKENDWFDQLQKLVLIETREEKEIKGHINQMSEALQLKKSGMSHVDVNKRIVALLDNITSELNIDKRIQRRKYRVERRCVQAEQEITQLITQLTQETDALLKLCNNHRELQKIQQITTEVVSLKNQLQEFVQADDREKQYIERIGAFETELIKSIEAANFLISQAKTAIGHDDASNEETLIQNLKQAIEKVTAAEEALVNYFMSNKENLAKGRVITHDLLEHIKKIITLLQPNKVSEFLANIFS